MGIDKAIAAQGNAVKHYVTKLVKSFGRLGDAAESLDDFRYTKARFRARARRHRTGTMGAIGCTLAGTGKLAE